MWQARLAWLSYQWMSAWVTSTFHLQTPVRILSKDWWSTIHLRSLAMQMLHLYLDSHQTSMFPYSVLPHPLNTWSLETTFPTKMISTAHLGQTQRSITPWATAVTLSLCADWLSTKSPALSSTAPLALRVSLTQCRTGVSIDSEHWQENPGLCTFHPPTLWVLQHGPILDMMVYHELSRQEGGNIKQKWGRGK
jgi:hypothetical protein